MTALITTMMTAKMAAIMTALNEKNDRQKTI